MRRISEFFVRRVAAAALTFLSLIAITFLVYWALPSRPAEFLYDPQHLNTQKVEKINHLFAVDKPLYVQYAHYLGGLAHGDLGKGWQGSQLINDSKLIQPDVGSVVYPALGRTLSLILGGAVLVLLLAVPLGLYTGSRIGSLSDRTISFIALVGVCMHPMVLGLIISSLFGRVNGVPTVGYCPLTASAPGCHGVGSWFSHLILPWITFALLYLALYTRMIRASVAETLHEDFVRTARSKGAGEPRVLGRHVLPSASIRILTMIGMEIGTAIGVCVYIEAAYQLQGLGQVAVNVMGGASFQIDLPMTLAVVVMITLVVVVGNLLVDMLYAVVDPRAGRDTVRGEKSLVGGVI